MTSTSALAKYTAAVANVKQYEQENLPVFGIHKQLLLRVIDTENELRDEVAAAGVGVANEEFSVKVKPQTQVFVDIEELKANAGQLLTPALLERLVKTQERPPYISITENTI